MTAWRGREASGRWWGWTSPSAWPSDRLWPATLAGAWRWGGCLVEAWPWVATPGWVSRAAEQRLWVGVGVRPWVLNGERGVHSTGWVLVPVEVLWETVLAEWWSAQMGAAVP